MPTSFWVISGLIFITVSFIVIPPVIRYYKGELKEAWRSQRLVTVGTILRVAVICCVLVTAVIMFGVKYFFYQG
jgi:hypothetical protein